MEKNPGCEPGLVDDAGCSSWASPKEKNSMWEKFHKVIQLRGVNAAVSQHTLSRRYTKLRGGRHERVNSEEVLVFVLNSFFLNRPPRESLPSIQNMDLISTPK